MFAVTSAQDRTDRRGRWEEGLDDAQMAVAAHGDGPLLVLAGAGTGKTRALVARVARLLERGVPPERLLLLTFTRRAADEMLSRAAALAGVQAKARPWGGTFHAVAHRFVAAHAEVLGFPTGFSVLTPAEATDLMELMLGGSDLTGTATRLPRPATLVDIRSRCVNTGRRLSEVLAVDYPWCEPHMDAIAGLFKSFTARKRAGALIDFDDLLVYWGALLAHPVLGPELAGRFDYVLVDEYQDLNGLQVDIVSRLAPGGRGLTAVGDEAQAVYGFRGASSERLRQLVQACPGAVTLRLERNFRSRQEILDVANRLRPGADEARVTLTAERGTGLRPSLVRCHDAAAEARAVVERILQAYEEGVRLCDQAVLVRAAHHSDLVEVEMTARRVPYRKYGGLRFLETAHVKDFVAAGRLLANGHDEVAWFRLLRLHDGVGPASARTMVAAALAGPDALGDWGVLVATARPPARATLSRTLGQLAAARSAPSPGVQAEAVLTALAPLVESRYVDSRVRLGDLDRLVGSAASAPAFATWLADLTLDPPASTSDLAGPPELDEDFVIVSTVHSAKGLEWTEVHIPHLVDGFIPIDMALGSREGLEEEQRLLYVAVTRARDRLHLYTPLRMHYHRRALDDRHGFATQSRFLVPEVVSLLDVVELAVPAGPGCARSEVAAGPVAVDLDHLWQ